MNGEEILKLIDAGFSADEIRKMQTETSGESSNEEQTQEEQTTGEVKPESDKVINTDFMDSITKAVSDLTDKVKAIQESNVKGAREPERKDLSTDEVIKSFIESM